MGWADVEIGTSFVLLNTNKTFFQDNVYLHR